MDKTETFDEPGESTGFAQPVSREVKMDQKGGALPVSGYSWRMINRQEFRDLYRQARKEIFSSGQRFELPQIRRLRREGFRDFFFSAFNDEEAAAWIWAREETPGVLQMVDSGVLPTHRRKGLYSALQEVVLDQATALGMHTMASLIRADHNSIIIPKLKLGFVITGLEIDARFGTMVRLTFPLSQKHRNLIGVRTGRLDSGDSQV